MKPGTRCLGVAFSDGRTLSTCAGAVVRADRVLDGLTFATCTVGGLDATETVVTLVDDLARPDVQYLFLAGVAPAWFNLLSPTEIHAETGLPTATVSFEASEGLGAAIREQFSGEERRRRLDRYESLPPRRTVAVNDDRVFVRSVGFDDPAGADEVVRAFTPEGGRPEPLRVARLAARAGREFAGDADGSAADDVDPERRG